MPVNSALGVPASTPIATIKGYRRTGGAVVTVARRSKPVGKQPAIRPAQITYKHY